MEQKAEELTKMAGAHPRPEFSVEEQVIQKPVMFWKQSEDFKGSFRIRGHRADYGLSLNRNIGNSGRPRIAQTQLILI